VADELHFGRAAQRLHMAQPALSQQIKRLEQDVGVELLRRTSRRVELTDAGRVFLAEANRTVAASRHAVDAAQRAARGDIGWLSVGFVDSAAYEVLPRALDVFTSRYPDVHLELRELTTEQQLRRLSDGNIDVGICRDLHHETCDIQPLTRESLLLALPHGHRLARRRRVRMAELSRERFILFRRSEIPRLYDLTIGLCHAAGFTPAMAQEAMRYPTMLSLVSVGIGIALVPEPVQAFSVPGVSYARLAEKAAATELVLVTRSEPPSPTVRAFKEVARQVTGAA
jgi:DNA-binding transcriptional LysR family regulator